MTAETSTIEKGPKNHILKIRLTREQRELIEKTAHKRGYLALAPYIRDRLFGRDFAWEMRLVEIDRNVRRLLEGIDDHS